MGIALGFFLYKTKSYKLKIPVVITIKLIYIRLESQKYPSLFFLFLQQYILCGWIIAMAAGMSAIFVPRNMYFEDYMYNKYEASFYAGLHRHFFAMSVAWIILTCSRGYAGESSQK